MTETRVFTPSPQQAAFFSWIAQGSGSCVLEAVAGAGKTTTLIHALELMSGDVFFGAYNKKIADEIKSRVPRSIPARVDVSTMHAAGFRFWRRAAPDTKVVEDKCRGLYRDRFVRPQDRSLESVTLALVSMGKQAGLRALRPATEEAWAQLIDHYDLEVPTDERGGDRTAQLIDYADQLLAKSVEADVQMIDFDDMIYAPLVHNARVWGHDWVLVDEAQDTNATRRALALRLLKRGGRLVAVGDSRQAIYGFTGADSDALDLIGNAVNAVRMPLTVTYRCPKAVVARAHEWVSHIQAHESAPEGLVKEAPIAELTKLARPGDAVLCRFTKPLIEHVYRFIGAGIPARVEGRDIGNNLKALAQRWKTTSLGQLEGYLTAYCEAETGKLRAKEKESKAAALEDRVGCLLVVLQRVRDTVKGAGVEDLIRELDKLFGDGATAVPSVTFSTIHKSKGREWKRVVWLWTGPSPWARKAWEMNQEDNLCYVAATRSQAELYIVA